MESTERFVCGSLGSVPDLRDYVATSSRETFPKEFALEEMPAIKNQGAIGSCVAHALSTVVEYFNEKETGKFVEMSTGYIYGNRLTSTYKGRGMFVSDALKAVNKFGDVPFTDFPHNVEVPYAISVFSQKSDKLEPIGLNYKIAEYFRLKDEAAIKTHLLDGNPVVISMTWFDDIRIKDGVMVTEQKKSDKTGAHCMVLFGWNEIGWKVQNSWGPIWGDNGTFVLPYNIPTKEVWGVKDAKSDSSLVLKKPFKTKFGAKFAKCFHSILAWVYNLYYKIKDKWTK